MIHPQRNIRPFNRVAAFAAAVVLGVGFSALSAGTAAGADTVGYVRLAHLSPDTPKVDVYLSKPGDSAFKEKVFEAVGYGVMSSYLELPVGTYAVSMRLAGAPASTPPVLTTQVTVLDGGAYTVAGVGKNADLGLKVLEDDLSPPNVNLAKVRIIQASIGVPVLDVDLPNGTPIASGVAFATTTPYQEVAPGYWALKLTANGTGNVSTVGATLNSGSVYSLLVLDSGAGLKVELRRDAASGEVPSGGVETGGGGAADRSNALAMIGVGLAVLLGLVAVALRTRRLASRRS